MSPNELPFLISQLQRFVDAGRPSFRIEGTLDVPRLRRCGGFLDVTSGYADNSDEIMDALELRIEDAIIHMRSGSRARAVRVLDVQDISRSDNEWAAATRRVQRNYEEWRRQVRYSR